jgi:hypothetical protein
MQLQTAPLRRSLVTFFARYDIRTIQGLLGHKDVSTPMVYTHVLNKGGQGCGVPRTSLDDRCYPDRIYFAKWQEGNMDTDDLTEMAHETITRAGEVLDVLRSEIGASASDKKTEDDFLRGVAGHLRGILKSARAYLDEWNYLEEVDVKVFRRGVTELLAYVEKAISTPYRERGKTAFD